MFNRKYTTRTQRSRCCATTKMVLMMTVVVVSFMCLTRSIISSSSSGISSVMAFVVPNDSLIRSTVITDAGPLSTAGMLVLTTSNHGANRKHHPRRYHTTTTQAAFSFLRSFDTSSSSSKSSSSSSTAVDRKSNNGSNHTTPPTTNSTQADDTHVGSDNNDGDDAAAISAISTTSSMAKISGSKLRRLKDMMWIRETVEDLTAAEFACTVETVTMSDTATAKNTATTTTTTTATKSPPPQLLVVPAATTPKGGKAPTRPRKRAVDYEKLLRQLNQRLRDLGCSNNELFIDDSNTSNDTEMLYKLQPGVGMGTLTYTEQQRNVLLDRIVRTRTQLIEIIHGNQIEMSDTESIPSFLLQKVNLPSLPRMEIPKEDVGEDVLSPKLYVRDDGTVDWDGALTSGAALRKFGTAVWARINGRETDAIEDETIVTTSGDDSASNNKSDDTKTATINSNNGTVQLHGTLSTPVTAKIVETIEIAEARESLMALQNQLSTIEKEHYRLLNSVISQGQATANVKLATLAPKVRGEIQASAIALENIKVRVSFQTLLYELERIYTYLMGELGNPSLNGYIPLQDRLNVAEFGLLESQVDTFNRQFVENDTIDEDVLAVVFEQLTDFKRRLGIDYYVAGLSFDREAIGTWLGDLWVKTKKGLAFYVKGVRLFWNDVVFCLKLINRAAQGYTLKPREVRTIRRTFKDVITFIPFVIILLIPLSPIGHVLVFGAIQRFFPDFFPSCFTEQRQNLLQLYETAEYSELVINENWNAKLSRIIVAMAYVLADTFRTLFVKLSGRRRADASLDDDDGSTTTSSKKL